jgi:hypothetical protein
MYNEGRHRLASNRDEGSRRKSRMPLPPKSKYPKVQNRSKTYGQQLPIPTPTKEVIHGNNLASHHPAVRHTSPLRSKTAPSQSRKRNEGMKKPSTTSFDVNQMSRNNKTKCAEFYKSTEKKVDSYRRASDTNRRDSQKNNGNDLRTSNLISFKL